jgi:hypothetical protein
MCEDPATRRSEWECFDVAFSRWPALRGVTGDRLIERQPSAIARVDESVLASPDLQVVICGSGPASRPRSAPP